jgi:hypothetical protein
MFDKIASYTDYTVVANNFTAVRVLIMSLGGPQNCIEPFPKSLDELFLLAFIADLHLRLGDTLDAPPEMDTWSSSYLSLPDGSASDRLSAC